MPNLNWFELNMSDSKYYQLMYALNLFETKIADKIKKFEYGYKRNQTINSFIISICLPKMKFAYYWYESKKVKFANAK